MTRLIVIILLLARISFGADLMATQPANEVNYGEPSLYYDEAAGWYQVQPVTRDGKMSAWFTGSFGKLKGDVLWATATNAEGQVVNVSVAAYKIETLIPPPRTNFRTYTLRWSEDDPLLISTDLVNYVGGPGVTFYFKNAVFTNTGEIK